MNRLKILSISISKTQLVIFVSSLSFLIPFFLGQPQLLVGTLVNLLILLAAIYLPVNLAYPVIFLPSIAVLMRGLVFGPFTKFLVLFLPIIWLGNYLLYFLFKKLYSEKKYNYFISLIGGGFIKVLVLFSITLVLYQLKIVPSIFLTSMGWIQLITVLFGGSILFIAKSKN